MMALKTLGDWFALLGCAVLAYFISVLVGGKKPEEYCYPISCGCGNF